MRKETETQRANRLDKKIRAGKATRKEIMERIRAIPRTLTANK